LRLQVPARPAGRVMSSRLSSPNASRAVRAAKDSQHHVKPRGRRRNG
jgi:hypothetical protein